MELFPIVSLKDVRPKMKFCTICTTLPNVQSAAAWKRWNTPWGQLRVWLARECGRARPLGPRSHLDMLLSSKIGPLSYLWSWCCDFQNRLWWSFGEA